MEGGYGYGTGYQSKRVMRTQIIPPVGRTQGPNEKECAIHENQTALKYIRICTHNRAEVDGQA